MQDSCMNAGVLPVHQPQREIAMNGERFEGICRQFAGKINESWGELTGDPLRAAAGKRAQIYAKAQQRRGIAHEESRRQLKEFFHRNRHWHF
jgi:uncharacterized protein YjbJ (UPF0337 family)